MLLCIDNIRRCTVLYIMNKTTKSNKLRNNSWTRYVMYSHKNFSFFVQTILCALFSVSVCKSKKRLIIFIPNYIFHKVSSILI